MSKLNLAEMSANLKALDKRAFPSLLFCIYEIDLVAANKEDRFKGYDTDYVWFNEDGTEAHIESWEEEYSALDTLSGGDNSITVNAESYIKLEVMVIPVFVTAFFTLEGAQNYMKRNIVRLKRPYIKEIPMLGNAEMLGIRNFITDTF